MLFRSSFGREGPDAFNYYETTRLSPPTPGAPLPVVDLNTDTPGGDQSLWLALLARSGDAVDAVRETLTGATLSLAIVPSLENAERVLPPTGDSDTGRQGGLRFDLPRADLDAARYRLLEANTERNLLVEPGVVHLTLPGSVDALRTWTDLDPLETGTGAYPPSLEETAVGDRVVTWIRIQPEAAAGVAQSSLPARFSVIALNGAQVEQRARVDAEFLGKGTGQPDQQVQLVNTPVLPDSVELTVGGDRWQAIDDLVAAPPEVPRSDPRRAPGAGTEDGGDPRVYVLDRASGTIRFGDGLRGARPPTGAVIQARYDYGGGAQGVVGIGAVQKGPALPSGVKVTNPVSTWGGAAQESVDEAQRRIADYLKRRDRLVTAGDFAALTRRTPGVDVGRVEVLPLLYPEPELADVRAEGVVTLLVLPASDPNRPDAPLPDRLFLDTICDYLDRRRLVTTEVHVRGPIYRDVYVSIGIDVLPGDDAPPVRDAVRQAVRAFLSPLEGGFESEGWPLQRAVDRRELLTVAARVPGVASVEAVVLADASGEEVEAVPMSGVELPRLAGLAVQGGPAPPLDTLLPSDEPADERPPDFFPVPVVPDEC